MIMQLVIPNAFLRLNEALKFPSGLFHNPAIKLSTYNPPNKMLHLLNVSLLVRRNSTKYIIQVQVYKFPNIFSLANVNGSDV